METKQAERDIGPPLLLTYKEACRKLGIGQTKLYELMRAGQIRNVRLAPQVTRIPLSELEAYVARLSAEQIPAQAPPPPPGDGWDALDGPIEEAAQ